MKIIDNWDGITIGTYAELLDVCKLTEPEDVEIGIIALLCGVEEKDILALTITDYQQLRKKAQFVANFPKIRPSSPKSITLNGHRYNITRDVRKMSTGAYIDFQTYSKQELEGVMVELLSCFLIPDGCDYGEGYDMEDVYEDIRNHMPVVVAYSMSAFFLKQLMVLTAATLFYSERMIRRLIRKEKDKEMKERMKEKMREMKAIRSKIDGVGLNLFR